jgi:hypothetical protein
MTTLYKSDMFDDIRVMALPPDNRLIVISTKPDVTYSFAFSFPSTKEGVAEARELAHAIEQWAHEMESK